MTTGFAVVCRLAQTAPPSTRFVLSSGHGFASGFLPTPPHDDAVALGLWLVSSPPRGTHTPELLVMPGVQICAQPTVAHSYDNNNLTPRKRGRSTSRSSVILAAALGHLVP